ncbi:hypothetical protein MYP_1476 [Sporocytophaga myxococcoides]|uniref:Helix-turn-helix domain-containing protein n=1 Tax=Sporocytophaga myxococcoides TaxID=153721 RepID=A0A098LDW2_9BACT|nr:helix-turn-helix domain-containing protein [Sporocytophaga myxococcoides]GAL84248.1 hypothetical protein MYP_1476 [Sporocytophaga myxococcoides]
MNNSISTKEVPFLSFSETQKALDCSKTFMYTLIDKGELKPKYLGAKPYFLINDILGAMKDAPEKY